MVCRNRDGDRIQRIIGSRNRGFLQRVRAVIQTDDVERTIGFRNHFIVCDIRIGIIRLRGACDNVIAIGILPQRNNTIILVIKREASARQFVACFSRVRILRVVHNIGEEPDMVFRRFAHAISIGVVGVFQIDAVLVVRAGCARVEDLRFFVQIRRVNNLNRNLVRNKDAGVFFHHLLQVFDCERPRRLILIFTNLACALLTRRCSANIIGTFQCDAVHLHRINLNEGNALGHGVVEDQLVRRIVIIIRIDRNSRDQTELEVFKQRVVGTLAPAFRIHFSAVLFGISNFVLYLLVHRGLFRLCSRNDVLIQHLYNQQRGSAVLAFQLCLIVPHKVIARGQFLALAGGCFGGRERINRSGFSVPVLRDFSQLFLIRARNSFQSLQNCVRHRITSRDRSSVVLGVCAPLDARQHFRTRFICYNISSENLVYLVFVIHIVLRIHRNRKTGSSRRIAFRHFRSARDSDHAQHEHHGQQNCPKLFHGFSPFRCRSSFIGKRFAGITEVAYVGRSPDV